MIERLRDEDVATDDENLENGIRLCYTELLELHSVVFKWVNF